MNEQPIQPVKQIEAKPNRVEQVKATAKEWSAKGRAWFKDQWRKITNQPREILTAINISVPTNREDLYLVDSSKKPVHLQENFPQEPKNKIILRLFDFLRNRGELPKPGQAYNYSYDDKQVLFGEKLTRGSHSEVYIDRQSNEVTHLYRTLNDEKQMIQNNHQMVLYRDNNGRHRFFQFIREVPGGWVEPEIKHQGNLKTYLDNGGKLTQEQVMKAINDLREMQNIAREAHGDLVKNPEFIEDFNRGLMRKALEDVEPYGYINYQNILVGLDGELIIRDFAGNEDPLATGGWKEPQRHDTKSQQFMENELKFFSDGLQSLISKSTKEK